MAPTGACCWWSSWTFPGAEQPPQGRSPAAEALAPKRIPRQYMGTPVVVVMVPVPLSRLQASRKEEIEDWPYLDEAVLLKTRSRKICMTCHWFRHHAGVNCIPLFTCQLHQGLDRRHGAPTGLGARGGLSRAQRSLPRSGGALNTGGPSSWHCPAPQQSPERGPRASVCSAVVPS